MTAGNSERLPGGGAQPKSVRPELDETDQRIVLELARDARSPNNTLAERAGGTIVRPAARTDWGGTSGAFADPDGYVWEVAHNPGWTIDQDGAIHIG